MRRIAPLLLKLAVSVSILALIASRVPMEELVQHARHGAPAHLLAALLLILLALVLVALRWRLLAGCLGLAISTSVAVRALFLGFLGGQVLPSAIGGDFLRGWLLARHGAPLARVVASVVADRLMGLIGVCLLLLPSNPVLRQLPIPYASLLGPIAVLASGALLTAFLLANRVQLHAVQLLGALLIAVAVACLAVVVAALAAKAYGIKAPLEVWLAVIPLTVLAAALPISIGGWGLREATMVVLAPQLGVPAAQALLVSLTLGVLNAIASLPGALVMLRSRRG